MGDIKDIYDIVKAVYLSFKPQFQVKFEFYEAKEEVKKAREILIDGGLSVNLKILSIRVINNRNKNAQNVTLTWEIKPMSNKNENYARRGILPKMDIDPRPIKYLSSPFDLRPQESSLLHLCHRAEEIETETLHFIYKSKPNGDFVEDYHIPLKEIKSIYIYLMCNDVSSRKMKLTAKKLKKYFRENRGE